MSYYNENQIQYEHYPAPRVSSFLVFFFNDTATTEIYTPYDTLSLHDALPISSVPPRVTPRSLPSATLTSHRLCSRTKLTKRPSGEILGSAIVAFPETSVCAAWDFESNHASAVGP